MTRLALFVIVIFAALLFRPINWKHVGGTIRPYDGFAVQRMAPLALYVGFGISSGLVVYSLLRSERAIWRPAALLVALVPIGLCSYVKDIGGNAVLQDVRSGSVSLSKAFGGLLAFGGLAFAGLIAVSTLVALLLPQSRHVPSLIAGSSCAAGGVFVAISYLAAQGKPLSALIVSDVSGQYPFWLAGELAVAPIVFSLLFVYLVQFYAGLITTAGAEAAFELRSLAARRLGSRVCLVFSVIVALSLALALAGLTDHLAHWLGGRDAIWGTASSDLIGDRRYQPSWAVWPVAAVSLALMATRLRRSEFESFESDRSWLKLIAAPISLVLFAMVAGFLVHLIVPSIPNPITPDDPVLVGPKGQSIITIFVLLGIGRIAKP